MEKLMSDTKEGQVPEDTDEIIIIDDDSETEEQDTPEPVKPGPDPENELNGDEGDQDQPPPSKKKDSSSTPSVNEDEGGESDEDEIEGAGKRAQKRIRQLVRQRKEAEEKLKQEAERRQQLESQLQNFQSESTTLRKHSVEQSLAGLKSEYENLQRQFTEAYESGNFEKVAELQSKMTENRVKAQRYEDAKRKFGENPPKKDQANKSQGQQQERSPAPEPDERALEWKKRNDWFQKDPAMTGAAFAIHASLIEEGFDPGDPDDDEFGADGYYREMDNRIRSEFPHKFDDSEQRKKPMSQNVAGRTKATGSNQGNKSSRPSLTKEQAAMADKLGISRKAYWEQLQKVNQRKGER
jgi:hypothetical protein